MEVIDSRDLETMKFFVNIKVERHEIKNPVQDRIWDHYLNALKEQDPKYFKDAETGIYLEVIIDK